jgi:hypothetical protein
MIRPFLPLAKYLLTPYMHTLLNAFVTDPPITIAPENISEKVSDATFKVGYSRHQTVHLGGSILSRMSIVTRRPK